MKRLCLLLLCLGWPMMGHALTYNLSGLHFDSVSQRQTATGLRQYMKFQSGLSSHVLIYEEENAHPPSRELSSFRQLIVAPDAECSIDLTCTAKAFCTGECRNMYYELSNAPLPPPNPAKPGEVTNRCTLTSFSCARKAPRPGIQ